MEVIDMKIKLTKTNTLPKIIALCLMLLSLHACKKADQFEDKLKALPQISYLGTNAYQAAYVVGDTMKITGKLQPNNNLQISIGGVAATIIKIDSVLGPAASINGQLVNTMEDQVSILITAAMAGAAREVKVTTGGYSITGTPVDILSVGGPGSFNSILKSVQVTSAILSNAYKFLYAVTGKGDVYYYAPATKDLRRIAKDGTASIVYDLSGLGITTFLAGGVDPQEQNLYFSAQLSSGYVLYKLNLQNNTLSTLNKSAGLSAPYEGAIGTVQMIVTGIFPDSKGNLYLGLGSGNNSSAPNLVPDAIARYNSADGSIRYIFKKVAAIAAQPAYAGMPGIKAPTSNNILSIRFSPDENLLYAIITNNNTVGTGIQLFDLSLGIQLQDLEPFNNNSTPATQYNVISTFSGLQISLNNSPDRDFGYLPMPGKRLQVLLFQNYAQGASYGFPKWIVFDFTNKRTYAYGLGKFQQGDNGQYTFRNSDQLLNYDETGNLYTTSNGISYLLKTQPVN